MAGRVKKKDGENLTPDMIEKVIEGLNAAKPITKTAACAMLNISYNTARLGKIIEEYEQDKETTKRLRDANRGKPAQDHEIRTVITSYLAGDPVSDIAEQLYRAPTFVKNVVDNVGIPERGGSYFEPKLVPAQCMAESFEEGQLVWSFKHDAVAIVRKQETRVADRLNKIYQLYVIEKIEEAPPVYEYARNHQEGYGGFYATIPAYELGSLEHLKKYGVDIAKKYRPYFPTWLRA